MCYVSLKYNSFSEIYPFLDVGSKFEVMDCVVKP